MEPNQQPQPVPQKKLPTWLTAVTPFSKALALILFIALPFLGFYLGMRYQERITVSIPVVAEVKKTLISTPTPTPINTSNWKMVQTKNFSIKYPQGVSIKTDNSSWVDIYLSNNKVEISSNPTTLSLNEYVDKNSSCVDISSSKGKSYLLGLEKALMFDQTPCGLSGATEIYSLHKGFIYEVRVDTQANFDSVKPLFNQILSTFKFIDQNQTVCNTNNDCQNGAKCMVVGPVIANQPTHKVCVQKDQAIPL